MTTMQFRVDRVAHTDEHPKDLSIFPFAIWVEWPGSGGDETFTCGGPVYRVVPDSALEARKKMGAEEPEREIHRRYVCRCMGEIIE